VPWQERFSDWESRGIKIIPVLSRPDDQWTGERGYVQVLLSFLAFGFFLAHLFPCIHMYFVFFRMLFQGRRRL
jgi:NAD(P)H-flavin reductase